MGTVDIERSQAVATFIPAKDMLTHSKGLLEMVKKYKKEMAFDKTILELSRNGVQVFIASHNYILAKYLEVLMKESDAVAFHALYKSDNGVKCETCSNFRDLEHNAIVSSFDKLLDEVFDLNMGE